jgi:hypothetical protein
MAAVGDWEKWSATISAKTSAPLSAAGPLVAGYAALPAINDFGRQLQGFGVFTALGPIGPLGALGPLGPLGPMGIHGLKPDGDGNFRDKKNAVVRSVSYPFDGKGANRAWNLCEFYTSVAAANKANGHSAAADANFMVASNIAVGIGYVQIPDRISFATDSSQQYVTVVVVPQTVFDAFALQIYELSTGFPGGKRLIASSEETFYVNWAQFRAPAGGSRYEAVVQLSASTRVSPFGFAYRLTVTASTDLIDAPAEITGDHIVRE